MRLMYDAASVGNIPSDAEMVGYYVDGRYRASGSDLARFTRAVKVGIAVFPTTNAGIVFDGPPDNATWPGVVDWVVMRRRAGVDPSVYTDADQWATGVAEFRNRGVAQPHWWIAKWNGVRELIPGAVAHQFQGNQTGGYDLSVVADYWPGVDSSPAPTPAPKPPAPAVPRLGDDEMFIMQVNPVASENFGGGIFLVSGSMIAAFATADDALALKNAGVPLLDMSLGTYKSLVAASAALKGQLSGSLGVSGNLTVS